MSVLAVVDLLNSVPPGATVPEGGVLFAVPAVIVWLFAVSLVVALAVLVRRIAGEAWWRRLRRSEPRVTAEALALSPP